MKQTPALLCSIVLSMALSACGDKPADTSTTGDNASAPAFEPPAASPAPTPHPPEPPATPNAVTVGSALSPDQAAITPKPAYATTDTVYASASTPGKPAGATATVYWTYQDGVAHKQEDKKISGDRVSFKFGRTDGMKAGHYNVEIDINDVPVGIADFTVQ